MDLRHLATFRAVLREGSFLRAARALGLAQPTVTLHIQELEAELGQELFDRRGRRRPTTPAGDLLASARCRSWTPSRRSAGAWTSCATAEAGWIRIGAIEPAASQRVTPLLGALQAGAARALGSVST